MAIEKTVILPPVQDSRQVIIIIESFSFFVVFLVMNQAVVIS